MARARPRRSRARQLLEAQRPALDGLAEALLQKESLGDEDIEAVLGRIPTATSLSASSAVV